MRIAVLDDYQNVARRFADWSSLETRAEITIFNDHLRDEDAVVERLAPFEIVCVMRERTPLTAAILGRLPRLRLICSTGPRNASIDVATAEARGVPVLHTRYSSRSTIELTWALILAGMRDLVGEANSLRAGGWQRSVGSGLAGRTLGLLGLGNIGAEVARIGSAFGMRPIAWSHNLTAERAREVGAERVERDELFRQSDVLSVHLVLGERSRGLVGAPLLALMKPSALLVNTSRGPIVDEAALIAALSGKRIAAACLDVFDVEPLPAEHPWRTLPNVLATPHIGYVSEEIYRLFYEDTVSNIRNWLDASG